MVLPPPPPSARGPEQPASSAAAAGGVPIMLQSAVLSGGQQQQHAEEAAAAAADAAMEAADEKDAAKSRHGHPAYYAQFKRTLDDVRCVPPLPVLLLSACIFDHPPVLFFEPPVRGGRSGCCPCPAPQQCPRAPGLTQLRY